MLKIINIVQIQIWHILERNLGEWRRMNALYKCDGINVCNIYGIYQNKQKEWHHATFCWRQKNWEIFSIFSLKQSFNIIIRKTYLALLTAFSKFLKSSIFRKSVIRSFTSGGAFSSSGTDWTGRRNIKTYSHQCCGSELITPGTGS